VDNIKIGRLEWAGHTINLKEERIPKKVLNGKSQNTLSRGMHYRSYKYKAGGAELG
jgi:hypothetical protein